MVVKNLLNRADVGLQISIKTSFSICAQFTFIKGKSIKDSVMERGIIIYAISTILILKYVSYISGVVQKSTHTGTSVCMCT